MATNLKERESDLDEIFARFTEHPFGDETLRVPEQAGRLSESRVRELGSGVLSERRPALTNLVAAIRAQAQNLEEAAQILGAPEGLLWKLQRRLIVWETIPQAFDEKLAESVRRSASEVQDYLRQPPTLAVGASYRADSAPEAVQESFAQALDTDPDATDDMRSRWQSV